MKVIDELSDKKERVDLINNLVCESFGKRFKGNGHSPSLGVPGTLGEHWDFKFFVTNEHSLDVLVKKGFIGWTSVGLFNEDGSSLKVLPEYLGAAKQYATMYESEFGKSVEIETVEKIRVDEI